MSDFDAAITAFMTHIRAVQISGANLFKASDVYTDTGQVDHSPTGFLSAAVRWTPRDTARGSPAALEIFDLEIEVKYRKLPTPHGEGVLQDSYAENGLASVRKALIAATSYLDSTSSPAISSWIRYDGPGRPPDSSGNNEHLFSLTYEALLEV